MPWVMVPVPEEHAQEVMQYVVNLATKGATKQTLEEWDDEAVEKFFFEADEAARSLLSVVARGVLAGKDVTDQMAADFVQLNGRETGAILREINEAAKSAGRRGLIKFDTVSEATPNGRLREKRTLTMSEDLASMVRMAERGGAPPSSRTRWRANRMTAVDHTATLREIQQRRACLRAEHVDDAALPRVRRRPLGTPALHPRSSPKPTSAVRVRTRSSASCGRSSTH